VHYNIIRTDTADAGIRQIVLYIAQNFGTDVALGKLDQLESGILVLESNSYIGADPKYPVVNQLGITDTEDPRFVFLKKIGQANIICARRRPKYVGGARAL